MKKIIKIKNIGRFVNFNSQSDDLSLVENTIIYGDNTNGKSTLVAIFHSLKNGGDNSLIERKTFGSDDNQEVEILFDDLKKYNTDNWTEENIEIFDNDFIKENVFDSDSISDEQKAGLYSILVGSKNKKLSSVILELKLKQTKLELERDQIKNKNFKEVIGFSDFLKLKEIDDIDKKIVEKEKEIIQVENKNKLKKLLVTTSFKGGNFSIFKDVFKNTIDVGVEKLIEQHKKLNWKNPEHSDNLLATGIKLLKKEGDTCIFCGQDIVTQEAKKLIDAFKEKFSEQYDSLRFNVKEKGEKFLSIDLEKEMLKFRELGVEIEIDEKLKLAKKNIDLKIKEKQENLNLSIDFNNDNDFKEVEKFFKEISLIITNLKEKIEEGVDINKLRSELNLLKVNQRRFTAEMFAWIKTYQEKEELIKGERNEVKKKTKELTENVNNVFQENEGDINFFLDKLNADFRLKGFEPKKHMGKKNPHYCEYKFVFHDEHEVSTDKFKLIFSDSDKRLLAFAMFLSKLRNDIGLENKIIVLDDPFSSFDKNRREKTVICLRDIKNKNNKKPKQKIILTHEESFVIEINKKLENVKNLKIHRNAFGSRLEFLDIDNFKKGIFFKDLEYIKYSKENSDNLDEAIRKMRPCLEYVFKAKYYFYVKDALSKNSINEYLKMVPSNILGCNRSEVADLNIHQDMHDQSHSINSLNTDTEKVNRLEEFLSIIERI